MSQDQDDEVIKLLRQLQESLGDDFEKLDPDEIVALRRILPHVDIVQKLVPHADYLVELAIDGKAARRVWQTNRSRILGASAVLAAVLALSQGAERFVQWAMGLLGIGS